MRYYFDVRYHDMVLSDPEGTELDGIETARSEAIEGAREIIAERIKTATPFYIDTVFEVRDDTGKIVLMIPFASVLLDVLDHSSVRQLRRSSFQASGTMQ